MIPKSSYSSFIAISFPESSLAFFILNAAKMDTKVSHNCADNCQFTPIKLINKYQRLRLQCAFQHKFCVVVRTNLHW